MNKIDVGESLVKHEQALQDIKTALATATTFEEFKAQAVQALASI